jgi:uncharacterized protein (TIGR03437 family)
VQFLRFSGVLASMPVPRRVFLLLLAVAALLVAQERITSFGGSGATSIRVMVSDDAGNFYVAGSTSAPDLPVRNAAQPQFGDAAIMRSDDRGRTWVKTRTPDDPVVAVVPDPINRSVVFAGTIGGILKSTDAGETWRSVYRMLRSYPGIENLVIDPANSMQLAASVPQHGIIVSLDGGETWIENGFACSDSSCRDRVFAGPGVLATSTRISRDWGRTSKPFQAGGVTSLAFNPSRPGWIYAATAGGVSGRLRLTKDYGDTWTDLAVPPTGFSAIYSMVFDPANPDTIYGGTVDGLWRSSDGGAVWKRLASANVYTNPGWAPQMAVLPQSCSGGGIFAIAAGAGVTMSADGGSTWTSFSSPRDVTSVVAGGCSVYAVRRISDDAFVAKFGFDGSPEWTTFLGGVNQDSVRSIAVDRNGHLYVAGSTASEDFPASIRHGTSGSQASFITKFGADGTIEWSVLLGGYGAYAIALDRDGNVYAVGQTSSTLFPITEGAIGRELRGINGAPEGYLIKLSSDGQVVYSTLLGSDNEGLQVPTALVVTDAGEAIVGAYGFDADLPPVGGPALLRVNASGSAYAARLALDKPPSALTLAPDGSVWSVSTSNSYVPGYGPPACLAGSAAASRFGAIVDQFDPETLERRRSTVVGRGCDVSAGGLTIDEAGTITLSLSSGAGFPLKTPVLGASCYSSMGSVVARVTGMGDPTFSTYAGCSGAPPMAFARDGRLLVSISEAGNAVVLALDPNPAPALSLDRITNALSGYDGSVVAGGLYGVFVAGMDAEWRDPGLNAVELPLILAGVQVTFDGVPARIMQTDRGRAIVVAPGELSSTTTIQVSFDGKVSNEVRMPVAGGWPGLLTRGFPELPSGVMDGNVRNEDGTLNGPENPAQRGSMVWLFLTGLPVGRAWSTWNSDYRNPETVSVVEGFASGLKQMMVAVPAQVAADDQGRAPVAVSLQSPLTSSRARTFSNYVYVYIK